MQAQPLSIRFGWILSVADPYAQGRKPGRQDRLARRTLAQGSAGQAQSRPAAALPISADYKGDYVRSTNACGTNQARSPRVALGQHFVRAPRTAQAMRGIAGGNSVHARLP